MTAKTSTTERRDFKSAVRGGPQPLSPPSMPATITVPSTVRGGASRLPMLALRTCALRVFARPEPSDVEAFLALDARFALG